MAYRNSNLLLLLAFSVCVVSADADDLPESSQVPVAEWSFDEKLPGESVGAVNISAEGPRPPQYPDFEPANKALELKSASWVRIPDADDGRFDFTNGDEITLEAWVNPQSIVENMYIVGKGRTELSGPRSVNQNWALRLRTRNGRPCVNFLFRSQGNEKNSGDWHRWTSVTGISAGGRWHHVAVSYRFGDAKSIRGFIDGKQVKGTWDMGGETAAPPVVDDDDVWIGSAMAGNKGNSFTGFIDNIAIHRRIVRAEILQARYHWSPPEIKPPQIPAGKVVAQLFPVSSIDEIPEFLEAPALQWQQDELAFVQLPRKYDQWGVRDDWADAVLVRAWTEITLPAGDYRLLVRSRGMSRLKIDGAEVLTTPPQKPRGNAHNHVVDLPDVPIPGMRPHWMNDNERFADFHSDGRRHRILYEIIVGGPRYRLEFGETCVAIAVPDGMFHVVSETSQYPLTDEGWLTLAETHRQQITDLDRRRRQSANRLQADFWDHRHSYAKSHLVTSSGRSIDELILARINAVNSTARKIPATDIGEEFFQSQVQPIFDAHCVRCHGEKQKGGLSVRNRALLLTGGESGQPAVTPGHPETSQLLQLVSAGKDDYRMPPKGDGLSETEIAILHRWISEGARMPATTAEPIQQTEIVDDYVFLRRVFIDTVGVAPTLTEARQFLEDPTADRRKRLVEQLLNDDRWADNWVGYWQDVFAENPNLLKPTLNNTGPFRWWIHEALTDNKPADRFATELIQMRGSTWNGGAAGFSVATENDVPMAAKAHVIASAFLGVNMKCARCHDAPYHDWKQSDLFQMAAMLDRKDLTLPKTSTVPEAFFEKQEREPLIDVTLQPGSIVQAAWPFAQFTAHVSDHLVQNQGDSRERLAALVTTSRRFAEVIANRVWQRLMGAGLVEPVDDWEGNPACDPELLVCLADVLIQNDYDVKELARAIFLSKAYQRVAVNDPVSGDRFFEGPYRRRMTAEQIVDNAFHATGQMMQTEPLTLDVEGDQAASRFLHFGLPRRSWEFTTLANERDRPSLALPRVQAVADVLKAFGWRNSRPEPTSHREETPNLIQPGVLANGTLGVWLTRLSDESGLTGLALQNQSVDEFVESLFLQILTRPPTRAEHTKYVSLLTPGYTDRVVPESQIGTAPERRRFRYVSWSNHLHTDANVIKVEMQELARQGDPPTRFLQDDWRQRAEDAVWALLNSPEMVLLP